MRFISSVIKNYQCIDKITDLCIEIGNKNLEMRFFGNDNIYIFDRDTETYERSYKFRINILIDRLRETSVFERKFAKYLYKILNPTKNRKANKKLNVRVIEL